MKVTLESTRKIVLLNGVPARIWEGHTVSRDPEFPAGIRVHAYVTRIAADREQDLSEFEKQLQEHAAPSPEVAAIPLRLIL